MEKEKDNMRQTLESEIHELRSNIKKMQKMETVMSESSEKTSKVTEMKQKLQVTTSFLIPSAGFRKCVGW